MAGRAGCNPRAPSLLLFDTEGRPPPGGYAAPAGPPSSHSKGGASSTWADYRSLSGSSCFRRPTKARPAATTSGMSTRTPLWRHNLGGSLEDAGAAGRCGVDRDVDHARAVAPALAEVPGLARGRRERALRTEPVASDVVGRRPGPSFRGRRFVRWTFALVAEQFRTATWAMFGVIRNTGPAEKVSLRLPEIRRGGLRRGPEQRLVRLTPRGLCRERSRRRLRQ